MTSGRLDRVFGRGRLKMATGPHVEVYREAVAPGEARRYTKRFLTTAEGDYAHWTEREWRILARLIGHGSRFVPDVVQYDRDVRGTKLVQTYDAGPTVDQWATLLPVERDGRAYAHVFEDCAHWWALAHHSLAALDEIHGLGLVHLDVKGDNVCIPFGPVDFDPDAAGQTLVPVFRRLALIDFAFSLVAGETLATPLPIGWQQDYDYQSPRLLAALEAGRAGDLKPTEALDGRCDMYSLAAMLERYLPREDVLDDDRRACGWTQERYDAARALILRIREAHDAPLGSVPHVELMLDTSAQLCNVELTRSLEAGWTLVRDAAMRETAPLPPTPVTRLAPPMRIVVPARDAGVLDPVPRTYVTGELRDVDLGTPVQRAASTRGRVPLALAATLALAGIVAGAAYGLPSGTLDRWSEALRAAVTSPSWPRTTVTTGSLPEVPQTTSGEAAATAENRALSTRVDPAPVEASAPVSSPAPVEAPALARGPAAASAERAPARPDGTATFASRIESHRPAPATSPSRDARPPAAKAVRSAKKAEPASRGSGDATKRSPPPAPRGATQVADAAKRNARPAPAPAQRKPPESGSPFPPTTTASASPAVTASLHDGPATAEAVAPPTAPPTTAAPGPAMAAPAPAPAAPGASVASAAPTVLGMPIPNAASHAHTPGPPSDGFARAPSSPPPLAQGSAPRVESFSPRGSAPIVESSRAHDPLDVPGPRLQAPAARSPQRVSTPGSAFAASERTLADEARHLLDDAVPRSAATTQMRVARVLAVAAAAGEVGQEPWIAQAALGLAVPDARLPIARTLAAADARTLHQRAREAYRVRRHVPEALELASEAFAADPNDADIAGHLAFLHLRVYPSQPERARQLALHAIAVRGTHPAMARIDDWTTFSIASALTGRGGDARNGLFTVLALSRDVERTCRTALAAYGMHGERLRDPVEALLQRLRSQRRDHFESCGFEGAASPIAGYR